MIIAAVWSCRAVRLPRCADAGAAGARTALSRKADQARGRLPGRRRDRHHRAADCAAHAGRARADHRGREHRRRRRLDRGQAGRDRAGRRLHADDDDDQRVRHHAAALQARLRSGEGVRAGRDAGGRQGRAGGRAVVAGEDGAGDGGAGEGRRPASSTTAPPIGIGPHFVFELFKSKAGRRHHPRAVSRRRPDDHRPDRRPDPRHHQRQVGAAPAHRHRQGARARRQRRARAGTT